MARPEASIATGARNTPPTVKTTEPGSDGTASTDVTSAVKVTGEPIDEGSALLDTTTALLACWTVWSDTMDSDSRNEPSPPYAAVNSCSPKVSDDTVISAELPVSGAVPSDDAPSENSTSPDGAPADGDAPAAASTVAVNVTSCPAIDGSGVDISAVAEPTLSTTWSINGEVDVANSASPEYTAVMLWLPTVSADVSNVAAFETSGDPRRIETPPVTTDRTEASGVEGIPDATGSLAVAGSIDVSRSVAVAGSAAAAASIAVAGSVATAGSVGVAYSAATAGSLAVAGSAATSGSVAVAGSAGTAGSVAVAGSLLTFLGIGIRSCIATLACIRCRRCIACVARIDCVDCIGCVGCVGLRGAVGRRNVRA